VDVQGVANGCTHVEPPLAVRCVGVSSSVGGGRVRRTVSPGDRAPRSADAFHLENSGTGALPTGFGPFFRTPVSARQTVRLPLGIRGRPTIGLGPGRQRPFGAGCAPIRVGYRRVEMTRRAPRYDDGGKEVPNRRTSAAAVDPDPRTVDGIISDGLPSQLPDIDPDETGEWIESLDAVVDEQGRQRARYLMLRLLERAREHQVGVPGLRSDRLHQHDRAGARALVPRRRGHRAAHPRLHPLERGDHGLTGPTPRDRRRRPHRHLRLAPPRSTRSASTTSSAARTTARRRPDLLPGPRRPRHLRPRLPRGPADRGAARRLPPGAQSTPAAGPAVLPAPAADAGLLGVPDRLDGPRPDRRDLPGPVQPLPAQPRPQGHLALARLGVPRRRRDGRAESLGAIGVAAREELDNLTFVINCNLQRLDGPVRGNGKIIQELESFFRGAGWNVIKVIWGREWDPLLART
jgi:hypothetical protein